MKYRIWILICLLSMTIITAQAQSANDELAKSPDIDQEALNVLKEMSDYLISVRSFSVESEMSYDVVQSSGVKLEFGSYRKVLLSRPNKLRVEFEKRDGTDGVMLFNGDHIWVHQADGMVYAKTEQEGDLDAAIDFTVAELHMKAPLADLFSPALYENVVATLTRAYHLGYAVLQGVECEHLLFSNDYADFQMWIDSGEQPLLKRVLITYREEEGQPQYRARFKNWNTSPENTKGKFEFDPPDGAERIRFYVPARPADESEENAS